MKGSLWLLFSITNGIYGVLVYFKHLGVKIAEFMYINTKKQYTVHRKETIIWLFKNCSFHVLWFPSSLITFVTDCRVLTNGFEIPWMWHLASLKMLYLGSEK